MNAISSDEIYYVYRKQGRHLRRAENLSNTPITVYISKV